MSKADQLGAGRFGGGGRPVSARRAAIGAATGVPTDGVAPPSRLPVTRISPNPENPRTTLGDLSELASSLKEHGQKQAITVMNRDAYIKANPARADDLEPDTTHVVVDGSSRLAAAREAGLTHLSVMVDDEQGSDGDAILESALVANIHRADLDPLDEARALQRLLAIHGSQVKLAKRLRKSQGWVSQRLALLNLSPELQAVVGEEPVELLRSVAKESHDRQEAALQELKAERARKDAERRVPAAPSVVESSEESAPAVPVPSQAVRGQDAAKEASASAKVLDAEPTPAAAEVVDLLAQEDPNQQADPAGDSREVERPGGERDQAKADPGTARRLPYDDGAFIAMHLIQKMSDTEFDKMLDILNEHQSQRVGAHA
ncbi:ParB/RepB/Spo0J family partition protein (plasmid) [Streptomyces sp. NBC_00663]|uniref:ParB/RepB/Spo0J family partition protein n=1 Tax=Streptomyces sp. NBC_00663 TaxID=2975801 RepID=UPI002E2EB146|nr:ParB/RepB/Spo0J family partition protein [Streptomyces sp. NBC_00663]